MKQEVDSKGKVMHIEMSDYRLNGNLKFPGLSNFRLYSMSQREAVPL